MRRSVNFTVVLMERIGTEVIIYGVIISCKVSLYMQVPFSFWFTLIDCILIMKNILLFLAFLFWGESEWKKINIYECVTHMSKCHIFTILLSPICLMR